MNDKEILQALGNRIRDLINEREYHSAYQFWIYEAGDDLSRQTLQEIIAGTVNPKFLTLVKIAALLNISVSELLNIKELEVKEKKKDE